jgi:hypothetical protein
MEIPTPKSQIPMTLPSSPFCGTRSESPVTRRVYVSLFEDEHDLLAATRAFREKGFEIRDAFTPYAVHGLDDAMGLRESNLPWVCFLFGLMGAALKVWFEFWATAVDWPIDVGGKPWDSLPAFVPITFEVMVLLAGLSTVAAFLFVARLYPGQMAIQPDLSVTNDRFALVTAGGGTGLTFEDADRLARSHGAVVVREDLEAIVA